MTPAERVAIREAIAQLESVLEADEQAQVACPVNRGTPWSRDCSSITVTGEEQGTVDLGA